MPDVTYIVSAIEHGGAAAARHLPLDYEELRQPAVLELSQEKPGHRLKPMDLVHEAQLRTEVAQE